MAPDFWRGKRVLLTGHTGFKGSWCVALLHRFGARITGLALQPEQKPSLWDSVSQHCDIHSHIGDVRDMQAVATAVEAARPEIVLHMAAQAQVREGYRRPLDTFVTNVLGTAHILEALRAQSDLRAVLVVTSDKVYRNVEDGRRFKESDPLGGSDPYSASKAASEMVVKAYADSQLPCVPVATARGGNVLGGGDWASERLVPDVVRALRANEHLRLRNPGASRPWQHVLDCLNGYLTFAESLCSGKAAIEALNFGPQADVTLTVLQVAESIAAKFGTSLRWTAVRDSAAPEKQALSLDSALAMQTIGWRPCLSLPETIEWTADWYGAQVQGGDPWEITSRQIEAYLQRSAGDRAARSSAA